MGHGVERHPHRDSEMTEARRADGSLTAHIVVRSHRQWVGDPRLGAFTVTLDGGKVGRLPVIGELDLACQPGEHLIRVRQGWFTSPSTGVVVADGDTAVVAADILRTGGFLRRWATFMFTPWRALTVTASSGESHDGGGQMKS